MIMTKVTKLNVGVNNDSLNIFKAAKASFVSVQTMTSATDCLIKFITTAATEVKCDSGFIASSVNGSAVTTIPSAAKQGAYHIDVFGIVGSTGSFHIADKYIIKEIDIYMANNNSMSFSIDELSYISSLEVLNFSGIGGVTGSVESLKRCVNLTNVKFNGTQVNGDIKTMLDGMVLNGRTSGTLRISPSNNLTNNGAALASNAVYDITFTASGWTINTVS